MIALEGLVGATLILSGLYLLISVYAARKLKYLHKVSPNLNTRKLFVMTCLLTCILRFMSFASMTALNYDKFDDVTNFNTAVDDGDDDSKSETFFDKASLVLFDFPDFCCVSAYGLLLVVWGEAYLQSRRHWLSNSQFRRTFTLGYLVFNITLYSLQVGLYTMLFLPSIDQTVLTGTIFLTMTVINLIIPLVWLIVFWVLSVQFAGFPFASLDAQERLSKLGKLACVWSIARMCWAFVALTTVLKGWLTTAKQNRVLYSIVLLLVFIGTDIVPILYGLRVGMLMSLAEKKQVEEEEAQLLVRESETLIVSERKRMNPRNSDLTSPFIQNRDRNSTNSPTVPVPQSPSVGPPLSGVAAPLHFGSIGSDGSGRYVAAHMNDSGRYSYSSAYQDEDEQDETLYFDSKSEDNELQEEPRTWMGFITNPLATVFPPS